MNFSGKFDANSNAHNPGDFISILDLDSIPYRGGATHTVKIPDAHLLFSGDFDRSGFDLIISDRDHRVVVPNYFHGEKRPTLVSPEGAPLDPKVVEALTGHVQYAQAAGTASAAKVVGHVVKMTGSASIVRNGVTVVLNNNDVVYQNDVVQTGSGSTLGLVLIDGTTFNMTANARLMLNDLVYDAASTSNTSLFTLVQGAASFVAGQVAKSGDMKVATPVATLGIRGTAVNLDISSIDGKVSISVVDQQDNAIHAVQVYNNNGFLIGTVTSNGNALTLTPTATFEVIAQESNKTPAQIQQEFATFQAVLSTYDIGKQIFPNLPAHTDLKQQPGADPQSTTKFAGTTIAPSDSSVTKFSEPVGGNTSGQSVTTTATAVTVTVAVATGTAVTSAKTSETSTALELPVIVLNTIVPVTAIPFVVTPLQVSKVSSGDGDHFGPVMSADGRFVTYDPDGVIYLYDRQSNATTTITPSGDGFTYTAPTISSDGHFIVYQGTKAGQSFVFVYDNNPSDANYQHASQLRAGTSPAVSGDGSTIVLEQAGSSIGVYDQQGLTLATITSAAAGASGTVWKPAISADGHVIAFWTSNLATPGGAGQLFIYDRSTGHTTAIANTATGAGSSAASFSADGHYIVYQAASSDGHSEIYLRDLAAGHVIFNTSSAAGGSYNPVISPDGHFIIFASDAKLTSDDTNFVADTYVLDVTEISSPNWQAKDHYKLVSALPDGTVGNAASNLGAAISAGGLFVAFGSSASNLSTGDANGSGDIFVVDSSSGHSVVIQETSNSPAAVLTATGFIGLTGLKPGDALPVVTASDPRFTAVIESSLDTKAAVTTYSIHWTFSGHQSDFGALQPGQVASQNFVITLTTGVSTTTIPVKVSVYDAEQPQITAADVAPVATAVTLPQGTEGIAYTITSAALLAGVSDIDSPLSSLSITDVAVKSGGGSIFKNPDGSWTYTPATGFNGAVEFDYTASDGALTSHSTASLNIISIPHAPSDILLSRALIAENTATGTIVGALSAIDADLGDSATFALIDNAGGKFAIDGNNLVVAGPLDFESSASHQITVRATDSGGLSFIKTLTIGLLDVNDAPTVAGVLTASAAEGNAAFTRDLLFGASDADLGETATLSIANVRYTLDTHQLSSTPPAGVTLTDATLRVDPGDPAFAHLAAGAHSTIVVSYDVTDIHGATVTQRETITITGTNNAPVVSGAVTGSATEDSTSSTLDALTTASDVDAGTTLSVVNVPVTLPAGVSYNAATHSFTLDPGNAAYQHLAQDETTTVSVSYGVSDGTATTPGSVSWTVTGVNDAPVVTSHEIPATGSVQEDGTTSVSGQLTSSDPDGGTPDWSVTGVGAVAGHPADYAFKAYEFKLINTSNPNASFDDTFATAPQNDPAHYSMLGTFGPNGALDDEHGVLFSSGLSGAALRGQFATRKLNLTQPEAFTIEARFGLAVPDDLSEGYGIRLSDDPLGVGNDNDILDLSVVRAENGSKIVLLRDLDHTTHTARTLSVVGLADTYAPDDQIVLSIAHASGSATATFSYTLLHANGTQFGSGQLTIPTGLPTGVGTLFNGETTTRAQIFAYAPARADSFLSGQYGTLSIDQFSGDWTYSLRNGTNAVQSLSAADHIVETFNVQVADGNGGIDTRVINVTVDGSNDAPVNSVPAAQTTAEDTAKVFSSANGNLITISDVDVGAGNETVTLAVTHGRLTLAGNTASLSFSSGDVVANTSMTFSGTVSAINTALNGLRYAPTPNFNGGATLTITTSDNGDTGGAALSDTDTIAITVTPVNDAPAISVPAAQTTAEDTGKVFSSANGNAITISDVDVGAGNETVTLAVTHGTLTLAGNTTSLSFSSGDGIADTSMTFSGTVSAINTALNGLSYAPAPNFNGGATLTITTNDNGNTGGGALSDIDTVAITVTPVNDAPVANNDAYVTAEDTPLVLNLAAPSRFLADFDVDGSGHAIVSGQSIDTEYQNRGVIFTTSAGGAFVTSAISGTIISNGTNATSPPNSVTFFNPATIGTPGQQGTPSSVFAEFVDPATGQPATTGYVAFTPTDASSVSQFVMKAFDLAGNLIGFAQRSVDDLGQTNAGVDTPVVIQVAGIHRVELTGSSNGAFSIEGDDFRFDPPVSSGVLGNDTDIDSASVTAAAVTGPAHGTLTLNPNGSFTYNPAANYNGPDSFSYKANDGSLDSNVATVNLTVTSVNDAPVAVADTLAATEDTPVTYTAAQLLGNDTDVDNTNAQLSIASVTSATGGTAVLSNGSVAFTPTANFNGAASFTYVTTDGSATSAPATVTVNVVAVNDAPVLDLDVDNSNAVGANNAATFTEGSSGVRIADLDVGISDVDNANADSAVITLMNAFAGDSLTINGPLPDGISATTDISIPGRITINLTGSASRADYQTALGQLLFYNSSENPDTTARDITVAVGDGGLGGGVVTNALVNHLGGPADFGQLDTFENGSPQSDDGSTDAISLTSVFGNTGIHYFGQHFTSFYINNNGNLTFSEPDYSYIPPPISGSGARIAPFWSDVYTYNSTYVSPGGDSTGSNRVYSSVDAATGTITVTWDDVGEYPYGDIPNAFQLQLINRGGDGNFDIIFRYENIAWDHSETARFGFASNGVGIEPSQSQTGAMLVLDTTPGNTGITGVWGWQVRGGVITEGISSGSNSNIAHTTITVAAVNDAPVAVADTLVATEDTPVTYTAAQLLGNDTDVDNTNAQLSIASVTSATGGTAVLSNGSVAFTPTANFNGAASFTYVTTDGSATSAPATVTVNMVAVNDAPVNSVPGAQTVSEDTDRSITGLSVSDADAGSASITTTLSVAHGTLTVGSAGGATVAGSGTTSVTLSGSQTQIDTTLAAANNVVYRGALNFNGNDTLTITTNDGGNTGGTALSDVDTVAITVTPVNDAPTVAFAPTAHLQFNGTQQVYSATNQPPTWEVNNVTLEGWVKWDGSTNSEQLMFYNGNPSSSGFGVYGFPSNSTEMRLDVLTGGVSWAGQPAVMIGANQWYHIALARDGTGNFSLYVDGALKGTPWSQGANKPTVGGDVDVMILGGGSPTIAFHGGIAEVRVWETARTQAEIAGARFTTLTGNEPGLAGYYPLDERSGTTLADHTATPQNLTLTGGAPNWQTSGSWPRAATTTDEDVPLTIRGLSISDADGSSSAVTLQVAHGALALAVTAGLTIVANGSTGTLNFTGTIIDINAALAAGVTYTPSANHNGADTLTITVDDLGHTGGAAQTGSFSAPITVNAVNDAPLLNAQGGTLTYTVNHAATAIDPALTVSDVDSTSLTGATVSITANFQSGQDVLGFTNQSGITGAYDAPNGVLTLSGAATVAQYQAALDSVTYFNSNGNPSSATRTISYQVDDAQSLNHASNVATAIVAINHSPVAVTDTYTVNFGAAAPLNVSNNDTDPDNNLLTVTGTGTPSHGTVTLNLDNTVTYQSANDYEGTDSFQYTISDGRGGTAIGTVNLTVQKPEEPVAPSLTVGTATNTASPTDGAALKTSLPLHAGDVVSFQWNFAADDYIPYNDFAFATINGAAFLLSDTQSVGNYNATGWQTFSYGITADGTYTVGQGVMNATDTALNSFLGVDNIRVNGAVVQSFENGLTGSTFLGSVGSVTSGSNTHNKIVSPTNGTYEAFLTSSPSSASAIEGFLGLTAGKLANIAKSEGAEFTPITIPIGVAVPANKHPNDTYVTVSGAPTGSQFNHGTFNSADNTWHIQAADLGGNLTLTTASDYAGTFTLSITATSVYGTNSATTPTPQTQVVTVSPASVNLVGTNGPDVLKGGTLGDTITGGAGNDALTGGGGSDTFVFNTSLDGDDTITDFTSGADILQISIAGAGFAGHGLVANGTPIVINAASIGAATNVGTNGDFIFDTTARALYWDANGGTGNDAILLAHLQNVGSLAPADFHLV